MLLVSRLARTLARAVDRLFGYDVFVAHRRADGANYAYALVERLEREKISSFIDRREYGPGDDLSASTIRYIERSTMLVVVSSPRLLEHRDPDWVLREIDTYLASRAADRRLLLPVDFGSTIAQADAQSPFRQRLADMLRIEEPLDALEAPPSEAVVEAITRQFRKRRRDTVRLRVFQGIAAVLALLLLLAGGLTYLANVALRDARRNLAANYMTAAQNRLNAGFADEAAALAAESLRNFDSEEARRLIAEHPPLDLSVARSFRAHSNFGMAIDPDGKRLAMVGYRGEVAVNFLNGSDSSRTTRLGREDLWGVAFTPDGARLFIGDDKGRVYVLASDDLSDAKCPDVPRFAQRVDGFIFLRQRPLVVVRAEKALYAATYDKGCLSGPAELLHQSTGAISDYVVDEGNERVILTQADSLVEVSLPSVPRRVLTHQIPIENSLGERPQPVNLALNPKTGGVAVFGLSRNDVFFLDSKLKLDSPSDGRPFGNDSPVHVHVFGFDSTGDRLIIGYDQHVVIWSTVSRRVEKRLRSVGLATLRPDLLVTVAEDRSAEEERHTIRMIPLDAQGRRPVDTSDERSLHDATMSLERSPTDSTVLIGTSRGRVLSFDLGTASLRELAREPYPIRWVGASPRRERLAYFGNGQVTMVKAEKKERQESLLDRSRTGLYSAAWLTDGTALVVGAGWTSPILVPADPKRPVVAGPEVLNGTIDSIVSGPDAKVMLREGQRLWLWDTRPNTMHPLKIAQAGNAALTDLSPQGSDGIAALTRGGLFRWRWSDPNSQNSPDKLDINGDRFVISANGRRAAVFRGTKLSIHDLPSGRLRATLELTGGGVRAATFSPDGSMILACTHDGPLILWSLHALDRPAAEIADLVQKQTGRVTANFGVVLPGSPAMAPTAAR